jgi:hypothetical protein
MILLGWTCPSCYAFNGEAKEELTTCRGCGSSKPNDTVDAQAAIAVAEYVLKSPANAYTRIMATFILQQTRESHAADNGQEQDTPVQGKAISKKSEMPETD